MISAKFLVSLCFLGVLLATVSSEHLSPTLGVSPADAAFYKSSTPFTCRGTQKTIPHDHINDDYCDCLDGSDEPGTPACVNGRFYCINKGYKGESISSSKVGDGICDCCDGSDEYSGKTKCINTCNEKGALLKRAVEEERKRYEEGVRKKKEYVEKANRELKLKREELNTLKEQLQAVTQDEAKLNDIKRDLQVQETEKRRQIEEKLINERYDQLPTDTQQNIENTENTENTEKTEQAEQTQPSETENQENEEQKEYEEYEEPAEEEAQVTLDEWTEEEEAIIAKETKTAVEETEKAVKEWEEVLDKKNDLDRKVTNLEKVLSQDFGPENEFYHMYDRCFDYKSKEYTYTVCPLVKATQHSTLLGNWEKWEITNGVPTAMIFSNGQQCWGGPKRSIKVEFQCGGEDSLIDVQEPAKCEYVAQFITPSACNPKHLEVLKINEESGHSHDEL